MTYVLVALCQQNIVLRSFQLTALPLGCNLAPLALHRDLSDSLALRARVAFDSDRLRRVGRFPLGSPHELEIAIAEHRRGRNVRQLASRRQGHQVQGRRLARHTPFIAGSLDEELGVRELLSGGAERPQVRAGDRSLAPDGHVRKRPFEQRGKLFVGQLVPMVWVDLTSGVAVEPAIGRRDDQHSVVGQHACHLGEHPLLLVHMLDHLEGDDGAKRAVLELGEIEHVAHFERSSGTGPVQLSVLNSALIDVDADDLGLLAGGQDRRPEALAAAQVQHAAARNDRGRPQIAMHVLVDDLHIGRPGDAPLSGPIDQTRSPRTAPQTQACTPYAVMRKRKTMDESSLEHGAINIAGYLDGRH